MNIRKIDHDFAVTGQLDAGQVAHVRAAGYRTILCARPDGEEGGQPAFAEIAREAERHGLKVLHIPVAGPLSPSQVGHFHEAMATLPRPVLGYCRSGARAAGLYSTLGK